MVSRHARRNPRRTVSTTGREESIGRVVDTVSEYGGDKAELFFNRINNGLKAREAEPTDVEERSSTVPESIAETSNLPVEGVMPSFRHTDDGLKVRDADPKIPKEVSLLSSTPYVAPGSPPTSDEYSYIVPSSVLIEM